jgi:hypothetical protein
LKTYWRDEFSGTYGPTVALTGGIYQGHYIVSSNTAGTLNRVLCFDIRKRRAWRFSNINAAMMASAPTTSDSKSGELFFGERDNPYVSRLGSMFFIEGYGFSYGGQSLADGNTLKPTPSFTTPFVRGKPGTKRWKRVYVNYVLEDTVGSSQLQVDVYSNQTLDGGYSYSPTGWETVHGANRLGRKRISINDLPATDGIAVKLSQNGAAAYPTDFRVFMLEAEVQAREQSH